MSQSQTDLKKLKDWLAAYPHWEQGAPGILPKELKEVSRQEDLLGNALVGYQYRFSLFWQRPGQADAQLDGQPLLDFQHWVSQQQSAGLTPQFGQVPAGERLRLEKSGLTLGTQTVTYTVTLLVEFLQVHEAYR